jgi:energy-converting hydrogenase Eha subunit B
MMLRMSYLSVTTLFGAQLSSTIFQLLFLLMDAIAGMPEIIGVHGANVLAM